MAWSLFCWSFWAVHAYSALVKGNSSRSCLVTFCRGDAHWSRLIALIEKEDVFCATYNELAIRLEYGVDANL